MWLLFSFATALTDSLQNLYYKKTHVQIHPILVAWSVLVISSVMFSPLLFLGIPALGSSFWIAVGARLVIDSFAFSLYITGVQKAPLTLTIPMLSLSPLLSLVTLSVFNNITPAPLGYVGVFITVAGMYLLHFDHATKHLLSPFKAIYTEKGVLYVAIAACLWSVVTAMQKLAIDNSSPYFYTAFFQGVWAICFAPVAYVADKKGFVKLFTKKSAKLVAPAGFFDAIKTITQNIGYFLTNPVYVNIVSNTSMLISSFFGWYFYKEKLKAHIIPTVMIVVGIVCITLAQQ